MTVKKDGRWGFIKWVLQPDGTEKPQLAIPCEYEAVIPFFETVNGKVALVRKDGTRYFINEKNQLLFNFVSEY